jgi:hypothetical protein
MIVPLDLFGEETGTAVEANPPCKCGSKLALVCSGKGPHVAQLRCASCGRHIRWISRAAARGMNNRHAR